MHFLAMKRNIYIVGLMMLATACVKRPVPETPGTIVVPENKPTANLEVTLDNRVGAEDLSLGNKWYTTPKGDSVQVDVYAYYISNIVLNGPGGTKYTEPESYHLVDEARPATHKFIIKGVTPGTYTSVTFLIGVDSARNVSGAQTGDLSPDHGMFWDWNTGYIMAKLEGVSPQSDKNNQVLYHLGGFSGDYSVLRKVTLALPSQLIIQEGKTSHIHVENDVQQWFKDPSLVDLKTMSMFRNRDDVKMMADNYADMFKVDHVE
jgi:hypothetical protein